MTALRQLMATVITDDFTWDNAFKFRVRLGAEPFRIELKNALRPMLWGDFNDPVLNLKPGKNGHEVKVTAVAAGKVDLKVMPADGPIDQRPLLTLKIEVYDDGATHATLKHGEPERK